MMLVNEQKIVRGKSWQRYGLKQDGLGLAEGLGAERTS